jgi:hypothetical protein
MHKPTKKKLRLEREAIVRLSRARLAEVNGGRDFSRVTCTNCPKCMSEDPTCNTITCPL